MTKLLNRLRSMRKAIVAGGTALVIGFAANRGLDLEYTTVLGFVSGLVTFLIPNAAAE